MEGEERTENDGPVAVEVAGTAGGRADGPFAQAVDVVRDVERDDAAGEVEGARRKLAVLAAQAGNATKGVSQKEGAAEDGQLELGMGVAMLVVVDEQGRFRTCEFGGGRRGDSCLGVLRRGR